MKVKTVNWRILSGPASKTNHQSTMPASFASFEWWLLKSIQHLTFQKNQRKMKKKERKEKVVQNKTTKIQSSKFQSLKKKNRNRSTRIRSNTTRLLSLPLQYVSLSHSTLFLFHFDDKTQCYWWSNMKWLICLSWQNVRTERIRVEPWRMLKNAQECSRMPGIYLLNLVHFFRIMWWILLFISSYFPTPIIGI